MYYFTNYFKSEYKGRTIKSINSILSTMSARLQKYPSDLNISDMECSDIESLSFAGEKIGLLCRASLEEKEKMENDYFDDSYEALCIKDLPISINLVKGCLYISTPLTLKKESSKIIPGHYQLSDYLKAAANDWKRKHPDINLQGSSYFDGTLIAIITRKAEKYNRTIHCDNDNLEVGRLINSICTILGIGDSCTKLDILTRFRECTSNENPGTEIIITSTNNVRIDL